MKSFLLFFLSTKKTLISMAFCLGLLYIVPAKAGVDDGLFLEILELFAKGAGMVAGDSASNIGSAIGASACWYCPFFELIFDVINTLATAIANKLSGMFLILLGVGTLFFLVFRIGKMLVGLQDVDLMQFLADIFKYLGRVMVASVLLTFSLSIFYHLISPVLQGTLTLGNIIYTQGTAANMKIVQLTRNASGGKVDLTVKCSESAKQADVRSVSDEKAFSPGVKEALLCNMRQVASSLVSGMASGIFTFVYGQTAGPLYLISPLTMLQGLILFLIFFLIFISYPFKLLDAMFQLAFVTALAPLWIVLWAFPATVGYAKKAWEVFFGACLTFFMVNVLAGLVLTILDMYAFPDTFWTDLIDGDMDGVSNQFSLGGLEFLTLIAMGILCLKILGTGKNLSSAFGGISLDLGVNKAAPQVAVTAASSGVKMAKTMGRLGDAAFAGLSKWGGDVGVATAKKAEFDKRVANTLKATTKTGDDIAAKEASGAYKTDSAYKAQRTRRNNQTLDDLLLGMDVKDQRSALNDLNTALVAKAKEKGITDANTKNMQDLIAARLEKLDAGKDALHNREAANKRRREILDKIKNGQSAKEAVNGTAVATQNHTFTGDIVSVGPDSVTTNFMNKQGLDQTNVYDENGQLKESRIITSRYLNGQAKTMDILDENGRLIGTRTFEKYNMDQWQQENTDNSVTIQRKESNKDGSVELIRDTRSLSGEKLEYEREKLSMIKGSDGQETLQRTTWKINQKTGEQTKKNETGINDGQGGIRVLHSEDSVYNIAQGKQKKGSGFKTVSTADYEYDSDGHLISRKLTDNKGNKKLRLYGVSARNGQKGITSYADFQVKQGKSVKIAQHEFKRKERQWF